MSAVRNPLRQAIRQVVRGAIRTPTGFDPEELFANGEVGVYYDPSDLSTLFQDSAGTIPVTAAGQPVGLMLDKSQGLVLGPELVISPYTGTALGNWVINTNSIERNGTTVESVSLNIWSANSEYVVVEFDLADYSGDTFTISVGGASNAGNITTAGHKSFILPSGTVGKVLFIPWAGTAGQATITNVSVKLLAGNHASQPSATKRPILEESGGLYSLKFDGIDDFMSTAAIDFSGTDKVSAWAGVTKLSDSTAGQLFGLGQADVNQGSFYVKAPAAGNNAYQVGMRGAAYAEVSGGLSVAPVTDVITAILECNVPRQQLSVNGVLSIQTSDDPVMATFGNYPVYIGEQGGGILFFSGNLYPLVIAGALYDASTVAKTNQYVAKKSGVTL